MAQGKRFLIFRHPSDSSLMDVPRHRTTIAGVSNCSSRTCGMTSVR